MSQAKRNELDSFLEKLGGHTPGGAVPGKAHIRDAAVYVVDTLELAAKIGEAVYNSVDHPIILDIYDRIDRERQRLEAKAEAQDEED